MGGCIVTACLWRPVDIMLSQSVLSNNAVVPISQLSKLRLREDIACLRLPCKRDWGCLTHECYIDVGKALGRRGTELKGKAAKMRNIK